MSKVYPSNPQQQQPPPSSSSFASSTRPTPSKLASQVNGPKLSSSSGPARKLPLKVATPVKQQPAPSKPRPPVSFKDRLLDAIYFLCPDCSLVQCSAILLGLMLTALLTVLFLYLGNFWSAFANDLRQQQQQPAQE